MVKKNNEAGLTLLEVLVSLVITGILATVVLQIYINQYGMAKKVNLRSDLTFSLVRAGQVLAMAIASADKVEWNGTKLVTTYVQNGSAVTDSYYIADKDLNGVRDLYREHLSVPTPIASRLIKLNCINTQNELWEITLTAGEGDTALCWKRTIRQRSPAN